MSDLRIDYSRAEADRRMRLLEMANGNLLEAKRLEQWVLMGDVPPNPVIALSGAGGICTGGYEDLSIPAHLRRTA